MTSLFFEVYHSVTSSSRSWGAQGPALLRRIHIKIPVSKQKIYSMASDWLAAVVPANQMPFLKYKFTNMDFNMEIS